MKGEGGGSGRYEVAGNIRGVEYMARRISWTRRVQVVYYLTKDGHLQHPHYMEVPLLPSQTNLRLRDIKDRLTSLRGKGMPSLYSWSCKRNYKNGYVWYDLCENDIIYPVEGAEYVLKGSEIVDPPPHSVVEARLRQPIISGGNLVRDQSFHSKRMPAFRLTRCTETELGECGANANAQFEDHDHYGPAEEEYGLHQDKTSSTTSTPPGSRCPKDVSTDEQDQLPQSSLQQHLTHVNPAPKRLLHNASVGEPLLEVEMKNGSGSSPSVLLQLIACGSLAISKAVKSEKRSYMNVRGSHGDLRRGVLGKPAARRSTEGGVSGGPTDNKDKIMIRYMSENPRFGNLQSQEKEYFSGSIVEFTSESKDAEDPTTAVAAILKRSNSFNDESRISMIGIGAAIVEEEQREKSFTASCLPRKNSCLGS